MKRKKWPDLTLHEVVSEGDEEKLKQLLDDEEIFSEIDAAADDHGSTPLHFAVFKENENFVRLLVEKGANVDLQNFSAGNPLHTAVDVGNYGIVEYFLSRGQNTNVLNKHGSTSLHIAADKGHVQVADLLLRNHTNVNAQDSNGNTALYHALGNVEMVDLLLQHGADPNVFNKDGSTVLHASLNDPTTVPTRDLLLSHGADVHLKNSKGENTLHWATRLHKSGEIVEWLLVEQGMSVNEPANDGSTPLHCAVANPNADVIELLVRNGADLEARDGLGQTPLYTAVRMMRREVIEYLLSAGADANCVNSCQNQSPLHVALRFCHDETALSSVVRLLLANGASVEHRDSAGSTALHLAASRKHSAALFDQLLTARSEESVDVILAPNDADETPLYLAVRAGNSHAARCLLRLGARSTAGGPDREGKSLLHRAVAAKNHDMVRLLLDHAPDMIGEASILHRAAEQHGALDTLRLLLERGANVNALDEKGLSVLNVAIRKRSVFAAYSVKPVEDDVLQCLLDNNADVNSDVPALHYVFGGNNAQGKMHCLVGHVALLSARNLPVDQRIFNMIRAQPRARSRYEACLRELERMRATRICPRETPATYLDLLVKRGDALLRCCLRSRSVREALDGRNDSALFPTYWRRIVRNVCAGLDRFDLMERYQRSLGDVLRKELPSELIYRVCEYFSNDGLVENIKRIELVGERR